ncbi:MAG TPA: DEAD/DEAH box helicase [Geminicoccaceae bacterium]
MTSFSGLDLLEPIQRAVSAQGYTTPTPIQAQAIPHLLQRRDLLGCAQTGTGKTAAFTLPILDRLAREPRQAGPRGCRTLILTPTRELAAQISDSIRDYGRFLNLRSTVIFGGVGQGTQVRAMARGVDLLVATPGRLLDLMGQGHVKLDRLEVFVLDEADRMLDMGFIHDVRRIIRTLPAERQTLLFSATMPAEIANLAKGLLRDPVRVDVAPASTTADKVEQRVMHVAKADKPRLLARLLRDPEIERVLVFARTKHGADRVAKQLDRGGIPADAIHGDKAQNARTRALARFRNGSGRVLVATDIAARGIDVDGITHVINFDLPNVPESYVHRIGRTARAGRDGIAISFCDVEEQPYLRDIEKLIRLRIPVAADHPWHSAPPAEPARPQPGARARPRRRRAGAATRRAA